MTPPPRFHGYAALLTGAGQGIGAATARRLRPPRARPSWSPTSTPDAPSARRPRYARRAAPPNPWPATWATVRRSTRRWPTRSPRSAYFDVLVNNAYANHDDAPLFEDETDEPWARTLDITLNGPYRCSRAALPNLVASGRGAIVSIGSVNGEQDFGGMPTAPRRRAWPA